jgi:hypothetical protein
MADVAFRQPVSEAPQSETPVVAKPDFVTPTTPDLVDAKPFTLYKMQNKTPLVAQLMDISTYWDVPEAGMGGDVQAIEDYLLSSVRDGRYADSMGTIKQVVKTLEKEAGVDKLETMSVKLKKIAAYVRYLGELKNVA